MVKRSPVDKPVNYESLTRPVSPSELHAFREKQLSKASRIGRTVMYWIIGLGFGVWSLTALISALREQSVAGVLISMLPVAIGGGLIGLVIWALRRADIASLRLSRFAHENNWYYMESITQPTYQGMIFQQGHSRRAQHIIYKNGDPNEASFEIGTHQYTIGSGRHRRTYYWTYASIELDRNVPHIVLDAKSNNVSLFGRTVLSNLPTTFRRDQKLSLEGDFDTYFTLYAPERYKRDAYYVFTPDLMALLIDNSHQFDAEVIDNRLFIYTPQTGPGQLYLKVEFMRQLLMIIHTVGMKMHRQTDYYADEHVADREANVVASHGRRLRHGVSWVLVIIVVLIIAVSMVPMLFR